MPFVSTPANSDIVNQRNPHNQTTKNPSVLDAVFLPSLVTPEYFKDKTVVVVDVLRATTTITTAIQMGCRYVLPQGSIESARQAHQHLEADPDTAGRSFLGGERNGQIIPGFHHGNSPVEYSSAAIGDQILILATTNGTVAMDECKLARRVVMGAMVNLTAVAETVLEDRDIVVLCSGTDRWITREDTIFAGALLQRIRQLREQRGLPSGKLTDTAMIALGHWSSVQQEIAQADPNLGACDNLDAWDTSKTSAAVLTQMFKDSRGGINLARIGHLPDIEFAAKIDSIPVVSELNLKTWQIHRMNSASG